MTILLGILALSFLIFFHELGHFLCARFFKVKINAFSIGIGPVVLHKKIKDTDYRISLIPLGGYCSMEGEKDLQKAIESKQNLVASSPNSFYAIHPFKRLLIAFSGPFFNFFFAIIAFTIIALTGYSYKSAGTTIKLSSDIYPEIHSSAKDAGLQNGDIIKEINGKETKDFSHIVSIISSIPNETANIKVLRNEELLSFEVPVLLNKETGSGMIGIVSDVNSIETRYVKGKNFPLAIKEGFIKSFETIYISIKSIKIIFSGTKLSNTIAGPARISSMLGSSIKTSFSESFKTGLVTTLEFLSLISISLFITNLLPIPILDGGIILFSFIEMIIKRKINIKAYITIQIIGIIFILLLMGIAIFSDVIYFIK